MESLGNPVEWVKGQRSKRPPGRSRRLVGDDEALALTRSVLEVLCQRLEQAPGGAAGPLLAQRRGDLVLCSKAALGETLRPAKAEAEHC